jgi:tetratricopeptide (TPR) repeat protein
LKDEKYTEYLDQIYFSLAEVVVKSDKEKAKEYYAKSSAANTGDKSLKAEACFNLAQLYMSDKKYEKAKLYFDTTLVSLSKNDERYFEVKNYAANLTSIAKYLETITRVDSLLAMAELPEDKLKDIAKKRLEEEVKSGKKTTIPTNKNTGVIPNKGPGGGFGGFSNFFAYNKTQVENGKKTFIAKWGQRKLEDNWRRSVKNYASNADIIDTTENKKDNLEQKPIIEISEADYKRVMSDIPFSAFQKEQMRNELKKALFELGKDYRTKLQEYELSANTLETFQTKFPGTPNEAEAYYYLFLDYTDLNKSSLAQKYKLLLNQKYADDKFAKLANDPSYLDALANDAKKLDNYYNQSFELFQKGQYDKVITRIESAAEAFGKDNKLMAKFTLLNAMCLGATKGKEVYITALKEVIARYPKSSEETKAKEILRFLNGDNTAFENIDVKEVDNIFEIDDASRHYVAVIILSYDADVFEDAKVSISDYNKEYHSLDKLQLGDNILSTEEKTQLILVRSFENKEKAMKYYEGVQKSRDKFISPDIANFEIYPITLNNYRKMNQDKSHKKYRVWFEKNYLKQ